jgi:Family of unknown function (DUF6152)
MRSRKFILFLAMVLGLGLACGSAFAHHGTAAYDESTRITLHVVLTNFEWANPHALISFDVKDEKGSVAHWTVETFSPGKLARAGWKKEDLKPGDEVTVSFYPAKNGSPMGFLVNMILPDGRKLEPR